MNGKLNLTVKAGALHDACKTVYNTLSSKLVDKPLDPLTIEVGAISIVRSSSGDFTVFAEYTAEPGLGGDPYYHEWAAPIPAKHKPKTYAEEVVSYMKNNGKIVNVKPLGHVKDESGESIGYDRPNSFSITYNSKPISLYFTKFGDGVRILGSGFDVDVELVGDDYEEDSDIIIEVLKKGPPEKKEEPAPTQEDESVTPEEV